MKLEEIWEKSNKNIDNYFFMLENLEIEHMSITYQFEELKMDLCIGDGLDVINNQNKYGSDEEFFYAIGGINSLPIYNNHVEYKEYQADMRMLKKELKKY